MKVPRKTQNALLAAFCTIALLTAGCSADDQTSLASSGGPLFALIGFAVDFGRQLLAAFLF